MKSLDMSQYVLNNGPETRRSTSSNNVYDLAAVIVHHGNGYVFDYSDDSALMLIEFFFPMGHLDRAVDIIPRSQSTMAPGSISMITR